MGFTTNRNGGVALRNDYSKITDWDKSPMLREHCEAIKKKCSGNIAIFGGNFFDFPWGRKEGEEFFCVSEITTAVELEKEVFGRADREAVDENKPGKFGVSGEVFEEGANLFGSEVVSSVD